MPEVAALREAGEETRLSYFKIVRKLGVAEYDMSPYRFELQRRRVFHLELTEPTPERWASQEDHDGEQEPTHFECFWIPLEAAHVLVRPGRAAGTPVRLRSARITGPPQSRRQPMNRTTEQHGPIEIEQLYRGLDAEDATSAVSVILKLRGETYATRHRCSPRERR
ncbi:NUDIX domain-containing protein [Streptomyces sp. NPDC102282]|uniref:NUDIX domain-containing protein n=1 Tax=Streptomyces sp. NPDC102282 TaxID=3366154 RepID=UPI00380DA6BF